MSRLPSIVLLVILFVAAPAEGSSAVPPGPIPARETAPRSPDGIHSASAAEDGTISLQEKTLGKPPRPLRGHTGQVHALAFSADGRWLASAGADRMARLWSVRTGKELFVLAGHESAIRSLAFSPDGRLLATASGDRTIRLWELASGQEVLRLRGPDWSSISLAFRPGNKSLLVADAVDGSVLLLDAASGKQLGQWTLQRLQATLAEPLLVKGKRTSLRVQAHWSGGGTQDVTAWAACQSLDGDVASVRPGGQVEALGPGRTAIAARYLGRESVAAVTVPYAVLNDAPRLVAANFIDETLIAEWKRVGLRPAEPASDTAFIRRASLHLTGSLPSPEELRRFLADRTADRRSKLIGSLLEKPEYADHWSREWASLLGAGDKALGEKERECFRQWIHKALRENWPIDRFARALLTAEGEVRSNGAAAFFLIDKTPGSVAETAVQVFLGTNLRCARCHRQPNGEWGREEYLGLSAFFAGVERQAGPLVRHGNGVLPHPPTGKAVAPRTPGPPETAVGREGPSHAFARWLTHPDNPAFARTLVNRYWTHLFGRALADPCGDARLPSQPALLEALARDFVKHGHDVKHLLRTICLSRAYQLGMTPALAEDKVFFSRRYLQRIEGETMGRIIAQSCGIKFEVLRNRHEWAVRSNDDGSGPFRRRQHEGDGRSCERPVPDTMVGGALFIFGGDGLNEAAAHPEGRIARMLADGAKDDKIVEELFLTVLSRPAKAQESNNVAAHLAKAQGPAARKTALHDVLWALMNTREFMFIP